MVRGRPLHRLKNTSNIITFVKNDLLETVDHETLEITDNYYHVESTAKYGFNPSFSYNVHQMEYIFIRDPELFLRYEYSVKDGIYSNFVNKNDVRVLDPFNRNYCSNDKHPDFITEFAVKRLNKPSIVTLKAILKIKPELYKIISILYSWGSFWIHTHYLAITGVNLKCMRIFRTLNYKKEASYMRDHHEKKLLNILGKITVQDWFDIYLNMPVESLQYYNDIPNEDIIKINYYCSSNIM